MKLDITRILLHIPVIAGWAFLAFLIVLVVLWQVKKRGGMQAYKNNHRWVNRAYFLLVPLFSGFVVGGIKSVDIVKAEAGNGVKELLAIYRPGLDSAGTSARAYLTALGDAGREELKKSLLMQQQLREFIAKHPVFTRYVGHRAGKMVEEYVLGEQFTEILLEFIETDKPLSDVVYKWSLLTVNSWFKPWFMALGITLAVLLLIPAVELFIRQRQKPVVV